MNHGTIGMKFDMPSRSQRSWLRHVRAVRMTAHQASAIQSRQQQEGLG